MISNVKKVLGLLPPKPPPTTVYRKKPIGRIVNPDSQAECICHEFRL